MNKRKLALFVIIFGLFFLEGCSGDGTLKSQSPNDALSRRIKDAVGKDVLYLQREKENDVTIYTYVIFNEERQVFSNLYNAINESINGDNKVKVIIGTNIGSGGGVEYVSVLSNFYLKNNSTYISDDICVLDIRYPRTTQSQLFMDINIYRDIKNIKVLEIDKKMQELADKEHIEWNKVWPTLERYEIME